MIQIRRVFSNKEYGTGGVLFIDGLPVGGVTLENTAELIPAGVYRLFHTIHHPDSPHEYKCLGIDVPGRTYIHVHVANFADELEGCVAVGRSFFMFPQGVGISSSELAFTHLMESVEGGDSQIEIVDTF